MKVSVRRSIYVGLLLGIVFLAYSPAASPKDIKPEIISKEPEQTQQPNVVQEIKETLAVPETEAHVAYPNNLIIPSIKVKASVLALGITSDGKMDVPNDFKNVGWYKFGARPGQVGSAVMGAHVDNGGAVSGVFKKLKNLKVGDDIYTTDSDGGTQHFKVVTTKVYNYKTQLTQDVFSRNDSARLNIITCYGTWLPKENTYNKRLVVFTKLVS
jgi:sortase A